ncbi:hypothetical protein [Actinacidiphila acidipaludis]|uniref:Lipoprotein n=1 Tax=Actinacidiphila acidipaludis TaxID=2873382 RepID=A0ABS7QI28_9ACTN|nr:hypothetical protein [Streptomyces acidipaludis]MBY8882823.1 hypothetical protein [Streptomyces acidipaludis]
MVLGAACATLATVAALRSGPAPHEDGSGDGGATGGPTAPQAGQALAVARQEFGLLSGGGWAQAWDLWTPTAQRAVPQAEFVRVNTECRPPVGVPYVIDASSVPDPTTVRVDWHRADTTGSATLSYRAGRWRFAPDARTLADYRPGADRLIQNRTAAGSCH